MVAAIGLGAAVLYVLWSAPGIQVYDTAELATAAFRLGVSHPPGQPAYAILGKLAQLVPLGSISFRSNVLSALTAALSVWLTGELAREWSARLAPSRLLALSAPLAALTLATSGPLVCQATRTEVYAPALALGLAALLLVSRALRPGADGSPVPDSPVSPHPGELRSPGTPAARVVPRLAAAGLLAGLAASMHPAAGLGAGVVGLSAVLLLRPSVLAGPRAWLFTIAGLVLGNAPLAFVVLRCRPGVEPCWESRMNAIGFWRYVTGAAFRKNLQSGWAVLETIRAAIDFALSTTGFAAAIVVGLGFVLVAVRRGRRVRELAALFLAILVPFAFIAVAPFHAANPDAQGYLLPGLAILFAAAPVCALSLAPRLGPFFPTLVAAAAAALAIAHGAAWDFARSRYYLPSDLAERAFAELGPKAIAMSTSDHLFFAMQYGQLVEGARPDVGVMVVGLTTTSRHWQDVAGRRPEIELDRARPRPGQEPHAAMARAAMQMVAGVLPRWVENPLLLEERARSTGVLFRVGPPEGPSAPFPASIAREFARRRAQYGDGTDRVIRLWRQHRAFEREDHGEIDAAVREITLALWEDRAELSRVLRGFSSAGTLRPVTFTPAISEAWLADASTLRASLAQFLYRGGRTDLSLAVLERDFRAGNPQAALVLAEVTFRDGRLDEAERIYRTFERAYPERGGYALVGLAVVRGARGDARGAEVLLARAGKGADARLLAYRDLARSEIVPALLRGLGERRLPRRPSGS